MLTRSRMGVPILNDLQSYKYLTSFLAIKIVLLHKLVAVLYCNSYFRYPYFCSWILFLCNISYTVHSIPLLLSSCWFWCKNINFKYNVNIIEWVVRYFVRTFCGIILKIPIAKIAVISECLLFIEIHFWYFTKNHLT